MTVNEREALVPAHLRPLLSECLACGPPAESQSPPYPDIDAQGRIDCRSKIRSVVFGGAAEEEVPMAMLPRVLDRLLQANPEVQAIKELDLSCNGLCDEDLPGIMAAVEAIGQRAPKGIVLRLQHNHLRGTDPAKLLQLATMPQVRLLVVAGNEGLVTLASIDRLFARMPLRFFAKTVLLNPYDARVKTRLQMLLLELETARKLTIKAGQTLEVYERKGCLPEENELEEELWKTLGALEHERYVREDWTLKAEDSHQAVSGFGSPVKAMRAARAEKETQLEESNDGVQTAVVVAVLVVFTLAQVIKALNGQG